MGGSLQVVKMSMQLLLSITPRSNNKHWIWKNVFSFVYSWSLGMNAEQGCKSSLTQQSIFGDMLSGGGARLGQGQGQTTLGC